MNQEVLPLPQFIINYLSEEGVEYKSDPSRLRPINLGDSIIENTIESLAQSKTPTSIKNAYVKFRQITASEFDFIQHDFHQLLFPFFVNLALKLYQFGYKKEFADFIKNYRSDHTLESQEKIDLLLHAPSEFDDTKYEIEIHPRAHEYLIQIIEREKFTLLAVILSTQINFVFSEHGECRNFSFLEAGAQNLKREQKTVLEPILTSPPLFSVKFYPSNLNLSPSVSPEEDPQFLTQQLPDIAHFTVFNHNGRINSIDISKNTRLISMAEESNVSITTLDKNEQTYTGKDCDIIVSHRGNVLCTSFSDDSRYIASGGLDSTIRVSHLEAFTSLCQFQAHQQPILDVAWDPNTQYIAGASLDRTISMWSQYSPSLLRLFIGHTLPVTNVIFTRDAKQILTSSQDLTMRLWDIGTGNCATIFNCGSSPVVALSISADNQFISCGCQDGTVMLWDSLGVKRWSVDIGDRVSSVEITRDNSIVLASTLKGDLFGYELESGKNVLSISNPASSIDRIVVTNENLVTTVGRSLRGNVKL